MNNICQKTNFDLIGGEEKTVIVAGNPDDSRTLNYKSIIFEADNVFKFGYCTNSNEGINYPIFIVFSDGTEREFQIGKTGIFECQPELWRDVNDEDVEYTAEVFIREIKIYEEVPFVIDYCYSI